MSKEGVKRCKNHEPYPKRRDLEKTIWDSQSKARTDGRITGQLAGGT